MTTQFDWGAEGIAEPVMLQFRDWSESPVTEADEMERERRDSACEEGIRAERDAWWSARLSVSVDAARQEASNEAEKKWRERMEVEQSAVAVACTSFGKARERYFAEIEGEVVKLSLAVAAQVLQREAAMDPVMLRGVVKVALQKLSDRDGVVLRVPHGEAERWRKAMKASGVAVEASAEFEAGRLQLHTPGGAAELGVEAQLVEIERGFCDLLAKRPA